MAWTRSCAARVVRLTGSPWAQVLHGERWSLEYELRGRGEAGIDLRTPLRLAGFLPNLDAAGTPWCVRALLDRIPG